MFVNIGMLLLGFAIGCIFCLIGFGIDSKEK